MKKINWINHIIELGTVVFGILLAFALNSIYTVSQEKKQAQEYFVGIKSEIEINLKEVNEKLEYHQEILSQLENTPEKVNLILKTSRLKNFSWKIAENNVFKNHTDLELYSELVEIYKNQENLEAFNRNAEELMSYLNIVSPYQIALISQDILESAEFVEFCMRGWVSIFQDMTHYESQLKHQYEKVLEKLDAF